jgi:LysM repeat protein
VKRISVRKRIAALAATAVVTLTAGITVALSIHPATAAPKALPKPAATSQSFSVQEWRLAKFATSVANISAPPAPTYNVQGGDTLAKIATALWNDSSAWPALWYANKNIVPNPDAIKPGQVLTEPADHTVPSWMLQQALAAIPQSASAPVVTTAASTPAPAQPTGSLQSYALSLLGGNQTQFGCLNGVIMIESSWNVYASNASGAYGIPQALPGSKMAAAGSDWATDGDTQLRWMIQMYIPGTYGTACGAWAHEQAFGWY